MVRLRWVRSKLLRKPALANSAVVVVSCVAAASLLRWLLGDVANPVPFVTYFPAIMACTLLAGWRAGMASVFLSMAVVNVVFMRPRLAPATDFETAAMMVLFLLSCALLVAIAQTLRTAVAQLQSARERAEYLNQELLHRVRNSLTLVNSLAAMTYQAEPANFPKAFSGRMAALASGLDVLSHRDDQRCDLRDTVEHACKAFHHEDRLTITGGSSYLPGRTCVPLTLAIHELCTNTTKYGAFSAPDGRVSIELTAGEGEARLVWEESGGPPVQVPDREGLGSVLLSHAALGPAKLIFDPAGLRCEMRFQLA